MMDETELLASRPQHPWLAAFERNPDERFDEIIRGAALIFPYGLADPLTVLPSLFSPMDEDDPLRTILDQTVANWLERQRRLPHDERRGQGRKVYVRDIVEALTLVQMLDLPKTRRDLRDNYFNYLQWVAPLAISRANDPRARLWMVLAADQPDARFRSLWYRLCREAGARTLPRPYLDIGLLGLRHLPNPDETEALRDILGGIASWAFHLPDDGNAKQGFLKEWGLLNWLYTKPGRSEWRSLIEPIIEGNRYRQRPFTVWWREELGLSTDGRPRLRPVHEPDPGVVNDLVKDLKRARTRRDVERLKPRIDAIVKERRRWAEATGDGDYLVRTVGYIGGVVIRLAPDLTERMAVIGLEWQPSNPILWNEWGRSLVAMDRLGLAEAVFWEALRRFPDNEPSHVELARLLIRLDRHEEALALLEQSARRFPDNDTSHVELARLRAARGDLTPAVEGLNAFVSSHRFGLITLTSLGLLMVHAGQPAEAAKVIEQLENLGDDRGAAQVRSVLARAEAGEAVPVPAYDFGGDDDGFHGESAHPSDIYASEPSAAVRVLVEDARVTRADYAISPEWEGFLDVNLRENRRADLLNVLREAPDNAYARVVALDRSSPSAGERQEVLADFAGLLEVRLIAALQQHDASLLNEPQGDEGSGRTAITALTRIILGQPSAEDTSTAAKFVSTPLSGEDDLVVLHVHGAILELLKVRGLSVEDPQQVGATFAQLAGPIQDILRRAARMVSPVDIAA